MRVLFAIRSRVVLLGVLAILSSSGCGGGESRPAERVVAEGAGSPDAGNRSADAALAGGRASAPAGTGDEAALAELASLLARAGGAGVLPDEERRALEEAMRRVLLAATDRCEGCATTVSYVDEAAGGDHFRCDVRDPTGDAWAELHVFHRAGVSPEAAASWGRATLAGYPASGFAGEHLFVWPGRFEIRAFARADSLREGGELAAVLESLPLQALARL